MLIALFHRVTGVRRDEAPAAMWAGTCFFCVLSSYYVLRPVREEMGLAGGVRNLPWLFLATLAAMLIATPIFGWLVSRFRRRIFIGMTWRFFMLNLLGFYAVMTLAPDSWMIAVGRVFYIWISVFNLFVVSIFWALTADVFSLERSKHTFGALAAGGTIGAIVGAALTANLVDVIGRAPLILVSIVLLEAAAQCARRLGRYAQDRINASDRSRKPAIERFRDAIDGVTLTLRSPYLLGVTLFLFLYTFTSTIVYFQQGHIIDAALGDDREAKVALFANIDLWVNILTLVFQLGLASRIMTKLGVGLTLALLPVVTAIGFGALAAAPTVATLVVFQVIRRATNYGLSRPARETLYTVVTPDEKYKAKTFIDTFIYRGGDAIGAGVFGALTATGVGLVVIAALAAPLSVAWVGVAAFLGRRQSSIYKALANAASSRRGDGATRWIAPVAVNPPTLNHPET